MAEDPARGSRGLQPERDGRFAAALGALLFIRSIIFKLPIEPLTQLLSYLAPRSAINLPENVVNCTHDSAPGIIPHNNLLPLRKLTSVQLASSSLGKDVHVE